MKKSVLIWLAVGAALVLTGSVIFGGVLFMLNFNFSGLSTEKYERNGYELTEEYKNIKVVTDTADVQFAPSEDGATFVECFEDKNEKHSVTVTDGTLMIEIKNEKKWYNYIGMNFKTPKIKVFLPEGEYGALSVEGSTGNVSIPKAFSFESIDVAISTGHVESRAAASKDIRICTSTGGILLESISAENLYLTASTGRITVKGAECTGDVSVVVTTGKTDLTDVSCKSLSSVGNTGDIDLTGVVASEKLSVERSTGDVEFEKCDAAEIFVVTDTGDVSGSLSSEKVFVTKTDTGKIDVPKTTAGGICEISTDTGDIEITVE